MAKADKTNVMRLLELHEIDYHSFKWSEWDKDEVEIPIYKTLVTVGKSKDNYVFLIPRDQALNLKKAAKAVGEKNIMMIPEKELLPLTGYVHGGCSPIGMKKEFPTVVDASAFDYESIIFSAGNTNYGVQLDPNDIRKIIDIQVASVSKRKER